MRNPKWTRDELILSLDLYFRYPPNKISQTHKEVIRLSEILNSLPIHPRNTEYEKFRNPNGVYMKLCNFLRFDPDYKGSGLTSGGKLEKEIWDEFSSRRDELRKVSQSIIDNMSEVSQSNETETYDEDEEFEEGKVLTKLHKIRERSSSIVKKKKEQVLKTKGRLSCEVCNFDFKQFYGDIGSGMSECHHTKPVSTLKKGEKTKLSDLSILCSNCHRVIHKSRPMLSVIEMRDIVSHSSKY